jgi:hypothetical protein
MTGLRDLVAAELATPVDPRVAAMAAAIAGEYGAAARAVLFYGSCLREANLDGLMLDFYVIVSDYRAAYGRGWRAFANRLLPPNVFPFVHDGLSAKYAVLSVDHLRRETSVAARDSSTYARFAQPMRLIWAASVEAEALVATAVAQAAPTLLSLVAPLVPEGERSDPLAIWRTAFALTYRAELRAERAGRATSIVEADPERYRRVGAAIRADDPGLDGAWSAPQRATVERAWRSAARRGKRRQLLKLAKATTTFAGGIDYLAWKINRHAGTAIAIRPWQRRWPILGAISLLPRLWTRGAVR